MPTRMYRGDESLIVSLNYVHIPYVHNRQETKVVRKGAYHGGGGYRMESEMIASDDVTLEGTRVSPINRLVYGRDSDASRGMRFFVFLVSLLFSHR